MPLADGDLRDLLRQVPASETRDDFFEELDERMRRQDRAAARRWRTTATALAVLAIAAMGAAATQAGPGKPARATTAAALRGPTSSLGPPHLLGQYTLVEMQASCTVPARLTLGASPQAGRHAARISVAAGKTLFSAQALVKDYVHDTTCRPGSISPEFGRNGLPAAGVFRKGSARGLSGVCAFKGRAYLDEQVYLDIDDFPIEVELAVWQQTGSNLRQLAYVEWTPSSVRAFLSSHCTH